METSVWKKDVSREMALALLNVTIPLGLVLFIWGFLNFWRYSCPWVFVFFKLIFYVLWPLLIIVGLGLSGRAMRAKQKGAGLSLVLNIGMLLLFTAGVLNVLWMRVNLTGPLIAASRQNTMRLAKAAIAERERRIQEAMTGETELSAPVAQTVSQPVSETASVFAAEEPAAVEARNPAVPAPEELKGSSGGITEVREGVPVNQLPPEAVQLMKESGCVNCGAAPDSAEIVLKRGACFGTCPVYTLSISADGKVVFDGERYVSLLGHQEKTVPAGQVRQLFQKFKDMNFEELAQQAAALQCTTRVTDVPTTEISLVENTRTVTMLKDGRCFSDPLFKQLDVLAQAVEEAAGVAAWVSSPGDQPQTEDYRP